jgi:hypothetical protein
MKSRGIPEPVPATGDPANVGSWMGDSGPNYGIGIGAGGEGLPGYGLGSGQEQGVPQVVNSDQFASAVYPGFDGSTGAS